MCLRLTSLYMNECKAPCPLVRDSFLGPKLLIRQFLGSQVVNRVLTIRLVQWLALVFPTKERKKDIDFPGWWRVTQPKQRIISPRSMIDPFFFQTRQKYDVCTTKICSMHSFYQHTWPRPWKFGRKKMMRTHILLDTTEIMMGHPYIYIYI